MSKLDQHVLTELRKMIASGELAAGERILEISTAERLKVSRMPVRMALRVLEQEGLLIKSGGRSYAVRTVTTEDIAGAMEVRGLLESLAARHAAERGISEQARVMLQVCLEEGDRLFEKGYVLFEELESYHNLSMRFHQVIIEASRNRVITEALARNDHLPFAWGSSLALDRDDLPQVFRRLNFAHRQHHIVFDALVSGKGARAEAIMRAHATRPCCTRNISCNSVRV